MSDQLNQIDHIVVLMLENRSFDHMLGYLSLEGGRTDVDGLTGNESNFLDDQEFTVQRMGSAIMNGDPCHEWDCVSEQLDNDNGGFVSSYAKHVASHPELVMHYFNAADVPAYATSRARRPSATAGSARSPGGQTPNATARIDAANDLSVLLTEQQPRTDFTNAPVIPNVPMDFQDHFRLGTSDTELQDELGKIAAKAMKEGVPPEKL